MLLWFVGTGLVAMWYTFRDPAIDHRLVILGTLLPDLIDGLSGSPWALHTLSAPIVVMVMVMEQEQEMKQQHLQLLLT